MSETGPESARDRQIRERARSQMRSLRMYLLFEVLGVFGAVLVVLSSFDGLGIFRLFSPYLRADFIRLGVLGVGANLVLFGIAAAAMIFLRYGLVWPRSVSWQVARLERQADPNQHAPSDIDDDEEEESAEDEDEGEDEGEDESIVDTLIGRLQQEIESQGNRANLNLVVGGMTALIALAFLVWATLDTSHRLEDAIAHSSKVDIGSTLQAYLYWGPLMSKVLMSSTAAFFAFFFLSTYRRNLAEIRYFHNELTNVETKVIAVELCGDAAVGASTKLEILKGMGSTERNFILRKGESTTDLVQKDLDRQEMSSWAEAIVLAMNKVENRKL